MSARTTEHITTLMGMPFAPDIHPEANKRPPSVCTHSHSSQCEPEGWASRQQLPTRYCGGPPNQKELDRKRAETSEP